MYESIDFAKYKFDKNFRDWLPQFTMFISVGSTSTQGWIKDVENPQLDYKVVVPPGPTSTEFQTIGAKSDGDPTPLCNIISEHLQNPENKVLFFNAIGYLIDPSKVQPRPISFSENAFINKPNVLLDALRQLPQDRMFVFPKIKGLNFAPAWASVLARTNRKPMIDMGGGAVYFYYPDGTKDAKQLTMNMMPNDILFPEPTSSTNVTARSVALFTPEILASIEAKLRPQTAGRTRRRRSKRKTRRLK